MPVEREPAFFFGWVFTVDMQNMLANNLLDDKQIVAARGLCDSRSAHRQGVNAGYPKITDVHFQGARREGWDE